MPVMKPQPIIRVSLKAPDGERWDAIGGGDSIDAALEFALESAPPNRPWQIVGWRPVFES